MSVIEPEEILSALPVESAPVMMGTKENPVEIGYFYHRHYNDNDEPTYYGFRLKLPHGWLVGDEGAFVPFAEDGTGWGKNDPVTLRKVY